jgi:hypothetical protein
MGFFKNNVSPLYITSANERFVLSSSIHFFQIEVPVVPSLLPASIFTVSELPISTKIGSSDSNIHTPPGRDSVDISVPKLLTSNNNLNHPKLLLLP